MNPTKARIHYMNGSWLVLRPGHYTGALFRSFRAACDHGSLVTLQLRRGEE